MSLLHSFVHCETRCFRDPESQGEERCWDTFQDFEECWLHICINDWSHINQHDRLMPLLSRHRLRDNLKFDQHFWKNVGSSLFDFSSLGYVNPKQDLTPNKNLLAKQAFKVFDTSYDILVFGTAMLITEDLWKTCSSMQWNETIIASAWVPVRDDQL